MTSRAKLSSSGSTRGRCGRHALTVVLLVVVVVLFALPLSPASASSPPQWEPELREPFVFSTRAHIVDQVNTEEVKLTWHAFYALSEAGPWTETGSETTTENGEPSHFPNHADAFLGVSPGGGKS